MSKYINQYNNFAAYSGDSSNFNYPHAAYLNEEKVGMYDKTPARFYQIWGTVKDGTTSFSVKIQGNSQQTIVNNGYFLYNWTGIAQKKLIQMFANKNNLLTIGRVAMDTSSCTNIQSMFEGCTAMTNADLTSFDVSHVQDFYHVFWYCKNLSKLDISNWNTGNATMMESMFENCQSLTSLNLGSFNTSNVTTMYAMFSDCRGITTLNMSNWDMSNVTNKSTMFYNCNSLSSITLNNTNQTTLEKIQNQLVSDSAASHVTIHRDGYAWAYSNGTWSSTPE